ncbi:extensin family protein [Alsobacter sp. KACC 23698]|uniref:Extensin family protein n=1 Tax=Alsobacter sp. KACC 23698 TaxID=3149229 RepID=A0AAU7JC56_9HYPH
MFVYEQRAPWRDEAEQACLASRAVQVTAYVEPAREISGPGSCGMLRPFRVSAVADGTVALSRKATWACPVIPVIDGWVNEVVQPAAEMIYGSRVVELKAGSYSCRSVMNRRGGPRSEHAFGNAMDVMAFRLADGREVSVARGWRGQQPDQEFLREVFVGSCERFTTVLGPGYPQHDDHLHLDLARHSGGRRVCKPIIKFAPRLGAYAAAGGAVTPRPMGGGYGTAAASRYGEPLPGPTDRRPVPLGGAQALSQPVYGQQSGATRAPANGQGGYGQAGAGQPRPATYPGLRPGGPMQLEFPGAGASTPEGMDMDEPTEGDDDPFAAQPTAPSWPPTPPRRYP